VIAVEGAPANTIFETTVNDFQDGCSEPQFPTGSSADAGGGTTSATSSAGPLIRSPFGGYLNPNYVPKAEETVVVGARDVTPPRQQTPGLIFAECDAYPRANPGLVYDTDTVVVFWSWYAKTPELVQEHLDNAIYEVGVFGSNPFVAPVVVSDIQQRGANFWVFYTVTLGNAKPGTYPIGFKLTWKKAINDGYNDFGPGTAHESYTGTCTFSVAGNPEGKAVSFNFP
jgi:hypothetical protein